MKKQVRQNKKLKLEKFKVAKLSDASLIRVFGGGQGTDDTVGQTTSKGINCNVSIITE